MGKLKDRYEQRLLPVFIDKLCGARNLDEFRASTVGTTHGTVLEIGFGSGTNLRFYPAAVTRLLVVEPSARAVELAHKRVAKAPFPVEFIGLDGQSIDLGDDTVDCAVSTFCLCTVPDHNQALRELHRVLKPTGTLHILEHGLADDATVQRWQQRINSTQRKLFGGCNLTRHVPTMLTDNGFEISEQRRWYEGFPKPHTAFTRAVATPISAAD